MPAMVISRTEPKGRAAFDTSSVVTFARGCRAPSGPSATACPSPSVTSRERGGVEGGQMVGDPAEVMGAEAGAGDDVEAVLGQPGDGQVGLDPARASSEAGYRSGGPRRGATRWRRSPPAPRRPSGRSPRIWRRRTGRTARHGRGHGACVPRHRVEPVLPAHRVDVLRFTPAGANQFGRSQPSFEPKTAPAPSAAHRAARRCGPAGGVFLMREGDRCSACHRLPACARRTQSRSRCRVEKRRMSTAQRSKRRLAVHHPFGQNPARAAARGDAEGVEARADIHVGAFGRAGPRMKLPSGVKLSGAVDHLLDADFRQRRHAGDGLFQMLLEMVVVVVEQPELPVRPGCRR
jgi:hypothetical protein